MANNRRPQAPKRRNYVAKNVGKVHRPQTFRDRTKYDRYEDYLKDQLDDMVDELDDDGEVWDYHDQEGDIGLDDDDYEEYDY
jgi:hypothetical protein